MVKEVNYLNKQKSPMQPVFQNYKQSDSDLVTVVENKFCGFINLRIDADNVTSTKALKKAIGLEVPIINNINSNNDIYILGLGPSEWLIVTEENRQIEIIEKLNKYLKNTHSLVVDITGGMTSLNINGQKSQSILEKATYVNLHSSIFEVGSFYSTNICKAPAIIIKNTDNNFNLLIRRSFSEHIANWVIDASREYI